MLESVDFSNINTWGGLLVFSIQLVIGGFIYRFTRYMGKDGEYESMKKNIGNITHKVEEAKKQHTTEIEEVKSDLSVLSHRKNIYYQDERDAIIKFHHDFHILYVKGLMFQLGGFTKENISQLSEQLINMTEYQSNLSVSFHQFNLIIDSEKGEDLLKYGDEMFLSISDLYTKVYNISIGYISRMTGTVLKQMSEEEQIYYENACENVSILDLANSMDKVREKKLNSINQIRDKFTNEAKNYLKAN